MGVQIEVFLEFHSLISDNYRPRYCLRLIGRYVDSLYVQRRRIFFFVIITGCVRRTGKLYWALKCELFLEFRFCFDKLLPILLVRARKKPHVRYFLVRIMSKFGYVENFG